MSIAAPVKRVRFALARTAARHVIANADKAAKATVRERLSQEAAQAHALNADEWSRRLAAVRPGNLRLVQEIAEGTGTDRDTARIAIQVIQRHIAALTWEDMS